MSPNSLRLALLGAALLASPGCAWVTQNHSATAEYARAVEVASLRAADLEAELATADARIAQLEEAVRVQGQSQASRLENLDQVNTEITRLRGQIEELRFQVTEMQRFLDQSSIDRERRALHAERRLSQLEKFLNVTPPPPPTDADLGIARSGDVAPPSTVPPDPTAAGGAITEPGAGAIEAAAPPATAEAKLELAIEHMKGGRQAVARALLDKAVAEHPGDALLPEIRYRIGETWLNEKQYKKAAKAFQGVVDNHGTSEWAPWAMLRQGECFEGLGAADNAALFFQSVIKTYPKSEAAAEAKQKLGK